MSPEVKFKKLDPRAQLPMYGTAGAAGADLYALEDVTLFQSNPQKVRTGLAVELAPGFEGQIRSRSGFAAKGVTVANSPGTIDGDFRGEILCIMVSSSGRFQIRAGDRIAQLVVAPYTRATFIEVESLSETPRQAGGFGSTGVK